MEGWKSLYSPLKGMMNSTLCISVKTGARLSGGWIPGLPPHQTCDFSFGLNSSNCKMGVTAHTSHVCCEDPVGCLALVQHEAQMTTPSTATMEPIKNDHRAIHKVVGKTTAFQHWVKKQDMQLYALWCQLNLAEEKNTQKKTQLTRSNAHCDYEVKQQWWIYFPLVLYISNF